MLSKKTLNELFDFNSQDFTVDLQVLQNKNSKSQLPYLLEKPFTARIKLAVSLRRISGLTVGANFLTQKVELL